MSVPDLLEHAHAPESKFTPIYIAVLAVLLAICSIGDDDAAKTMIRSSVEAADTYAFFQAKNIRQTNYELAADAIEAQLKDPALTEEGRKFLHDKMDAYRSKAARYESEPATGEGKAELLAKAKALETERDIALKRDPYFDLGQGLLQIAIVLASISLIIDGAFLVWVSGLLAVVGTFAMVNAFTLAVAVPFLS
ncbi:MULTISPECIES: DUF4337 domain-containing protein [Rhodomicrobium]|uniref:DUF4337 domain-containing protein n=1 Tax=Rhodomicrobium TaxID=1068 RepID=UPI000B4AC7F4|nr:MULTISPECIES: DUF4337 domain-containing protein [Rhodomicrobium]